MCSKQLGEWCNLKKPEIINYVRDSIRNGIDYHKNPNLELREFMDTKQRTVRNKHTGEVIEVDINREKLANSILSDSTANTPFAYVKKDISKCWTTNCCRYRNLGTNQCNVPELYGDRNNWPLCENKIILLMENLKEIEILDLDKISEINLSSYF